MDPSLAFTKPGPIYKALLPSPFQIIALGERAKQAEEERRVKNLQQIQTENAKALDKAFSYQANPVLSQYQGYFDKAVKDVYDIARPLYTERNPDAREKASRKMSETDGELNIVKDMQEQMNQVRQLGTSDKTRYNSAWINNNLFTTIYNDDGSLKSPRELDPQAPHNLMNSHRAYNIAGLNSTFAKEAEEMVDNEFRLVRKGGIAFQDKIRKVSKFVKLDENGDAVRDSNGRIQINVTPEQVNKYLEDDGRRLWAEELVKEKQAQFDILKGTGKLPLSAKLPYNLQNAVEDLLSSQGYASSKLDNRQIVDKSALTNNTWIGGGEAEDKRHRAAAEYFYNLVHGDEKTKNALMGDISSGKDFTAKYEKNPTVAPGAPAIEPSKRGYVTLEYDPLSKFGGVLDQILEQSLKANAGLSDDEIKQFKDAARKEHKIYVNLDDEEAAWRELNYWRNLARNQDINSDFLKQAYDEYASKQNKSDIKLKIPGKTETKAPKLKV